MRGVCIQGGLHLGGLHLGGLHPGVLHLGGSASKGSVFGGLHLGDLHRGGSVHKRGGGSAQPPRSAYGEGLGRQPSPLVNRMTHRCKNITLPQTSFAAVII